MDSRKNLEIARKIIINDYNNFIRDLTFDKDLPVLKVEFYREIYQERKINENISNFLLFILYFL